MTLGGCLNSEEEMNAWCTHYNKSEDDNDDNVERGSVVALAYLLLPGKAVLFRSGGLASQIRTVWLFATCLRF